MAFKFFSRLPNLFSWPSTELPTGRPGTPRRLSLLLGGGALSQMRINLPRHDLLGEKRLTCLSEEKGLEPVSHWAFIGFNLHRNTERKSQQSLSGSNDQGIDNIKRTIRAYSESGSGR